MPLPYCSEGRCAQLGIHLAERSRAEERRGVPAEGLKLQTAQQHAARVPHKVQHLTRSISMG